MAYLRPPAFQRLIFNKIAMWTGIGNSTTLTIVGRKSGKPLSIPVVLVEQGGTRYLVSARGETQWVRNLRAAGGKCELKEKGKTSSFVCSEVAPAESGAILDAYKVKAGRAVAGYFKQLPSAADHPVFRLS